MAIVLSGDLNSIEKILLFLITEYFNVLLKYNIALMNSKLWNCMHNHLIDMYAHYPNCNIALEKILQVRVAYIIHIIYI